MIKRDFILTAFASAPDTTQDRFDELARRKALKAEIELNGDMRVRWHLSEPVMPVAQLYRARLFWRRLALLFMTLLLAFVVMFFVQCHNLRERKQEPSGDTGTVARFVGVLPPIGF